MLKEQFILGSDRLAFERRCSLGNTFACFAQRPITPTIQRAAHGISLAPAKIISHLGSVCGQADTAVKMYQHLAGMREGSAGDACRDRYQFLYLSIKQLPIWRK